MAAAPRRAHAAAVAGPALDSPAQRGRIVLGQRGEQLVGARVDGRDEGVGQIVDGEVTTGEEESLRGGGDGGPHRHTVLGGQRALIGEPATEQGLHDPGPGDEPPGHHIQEPLLAAVPALVTTRDGPAPPTVAVAVPPVSARRAVRGHQPPQQVDPVRLGQPQPPPEPRSELGVRPQAASAMSRAGRDIAGAFWPPVPPSTPDRRTMRPARSRSTSTYGPASGTRSSVCDRR